MLDTHLRDIYSPLSARNILALFGVILFGLGATGFTAVMYLSFALLLPLMLFELGPLLHQIHKHRLLAFLFFLLTTFITIRIFIAAYEFPDTAASVEKRGGQMLMIAGIPALVLAWSIKRSPHHLDALLISFCIGLLIFLFSEITPTRVISLTISENPPRLFFGGHKSAIGAIYSFGAISALWLLTQSAMITSTLKDRPRTRSLFAICIVSALTIFLIIVILNQSRTNWIGLAAALMVFLISSHQTTSGLRQNLQKYTAIASIIVVSALLYWKGGIFLSRLSPIISNLLDSIHTTIGEPTANSLETRFQIFKAAWLSMMDRPLFGWGPDQYDRLLKQLNGDGLVKWGHFHNLYLQFIVAYGTPAFLLFILNYIKPFLSLSKREPAFPLAIPLIVFMGIISLSDLRHDDPVGQALYIITLAIPLSRLLSCKSER